MQKTLEYTQDTLCETQENLKQANAAIRERDFVIANQREAEKALVGRAAELRKELEATAQDVAGLFAKSGMVPIHLILFLDGGGGCHCSVRNVFDSSHGVSFLVIQVITIKPSDANVWKGMSN